jgi:dTMP kinase
MQKNKGFFITIEGIEGVGKSTNINAIKGYLTQKKIDFIITREPGGTLLAEKIRDLLLEANNDEKLSELSELLLIFASRAQHLEKLIKPALTKGKWVICDRFTDATYAYQGEGRGLDWGKISQLEELVQEHLRPDLTIILDLDPRLGLERAKGRGELDRFEQEKMEFFTKVRTAYLKIAAADPERCIVIDASSELAEVSELLLNALDNKLTQLLRNG